MKRSTLQSGSLEFFNSCSQETPSFQILWSGIIRKHQVFQPFFCHPLKDFARYVISHIGSECPEPGPYKWCWLPTCYTRLKTVRVAPLVVGYGSGQGVGPKADSIWWEGPVPLRYSAIRVLGRQAQKWARVTRNKTVRAVRPKADNIWQVGPGRYIWYQSTWYGSWGSLLNVLLLWISGWCAPDKGHELSHPP